MALPSPAPRLSYEEYLALETKTDTRHEWLRGEAWAMAGGSVAHATIQANTLRLLGNALEGRPCMAYGSDLKVRIEETDRATYPDVTVVCGPREVSATDPNAIVNPTLIVEVLSSTTEASDRGEKFAHYRRIPSLRDYVLISQDERRVEVFHRDGESSAWTLREHGPGPGARLRLPALDLELDVDTLYRDPTG